MAETALVGQDVVDEAIDRLAGYGNAVDDAQMLSFVNEGKDEVWAVLKEDDEEFFVTSSQSTTPAQLNYFGPMSTVTREYSLPQDFREMKFIEILDSGFEQTIFTYKRMTDSDWRSARRAATVDSSSLTPSVEYFYTLVGKNKMELAQFPAANWQQPVLWYVRNLLDFELDDPIDEILLPFSKKIADYAAMRVMLGLQNTEGFENWRKTWQASLLMINNASGPRNMADAEYVEDFLG